VDELHLARDVLDKQIVDEGARRMGKVDGIALVTRPGRPPRVAFLETGPSTLAGRLHPALARVVLRLRKRLGVPDGPVRIPMEKVETIGLEVRADLDARRTAAFAIESWLRERVVSKIPGGRE
jgi:sporulation protein YlmC with PRC-barrel domain